MTVRGVLELDDRGPLSNRIVNEPWEVVDEAPAHYRDVQCAPHFHGDSPTAIDDGEGCRDTATLIDLDLDDVAPQPLRPRVVPGHASGADDGAVWVGPVLDQLGRHAWPFFACTPLRVFYGRGFAAVVHDDLTLGPPNRLPKEVIAAGGIDDRTWIVTYRSRRDTDDLSTQWWPLPVPDDSTTVPPGDPRLAILDPATLSAEVSWPVEQRRSVAGHGADVWICDRKRLSRADRRSSDRPRRVDVSALIASSLPPATDPRPRR